LNRVDTFAVVKLNNKLSTALFLYYLLSLKIYID